MEFRRRHTAKTIDPAQVKSWQARRKSVAYLNDHFAEDVTVEELAALSHDSVAQFRRLFRALSRLRLPEVSERGVRKTMEKILRKNVFCRRATCYNVRDLRKDS